SVRRCEESSSGSTPYDGDLVTHGYIAALDHDGEDTLLGHDTVTGLIVDGALGVALLADLRHLEERGADSNARSYRQRHQVDAARGDVLGKVPGVYVEALGLHLGDRLLGEQAHLTVPVAGMRVSRKAASDHERAPRARCLAN